MRLTREIAEVRRWWCPITIESQRREAKVRNSGREAINILSIRYMRQNQCCTCYWLSVPCQQTSRARCGSWLNTEIQRLPRVQLCTYSIVSYYQGILSSISSSRMETNSDLDLSSRNLILCVAWIPDSIVINIITCWNREAWLGFHLSTVRSSCGIKWYNIEFEQFWLKLLICHFTTLKQSTRPFSNVLVTIALQCKIL